MHLWNARPAEAGGFGLRLKAGRVGHSADSPLSHDWERTRVRVEWVTINFTPHPALSPRRGEGASLQAGGFADPTRAGGLGQFSPLP